MKNTWLAITVEEPYKNAPEKLGQYTYIMKIFEQDNLVAVLNRVKGIKTANVFQTKKKAESVAAYWNQCARANGKFLFDETF